MCPLVSGIKTKDAALSSELGMRALDLAVGSAVLAHDAETKEENDEPSVSKDDKGILLPGGNLVIKLLESEDMRGKLPIFHRQTVFFTANNCS